MSIKLITKPTLLFSGFSLIEMAVVLLIVALLLGGLLPTISSQIELKNRNDTKKQLEEIQQALVGYVLANGRLPCPADGTKISGQATAGQEVVTGSGPTVTCPPANVTNNAAWGVLPWATLGVSETDAWGRRFTYRVTLEFADAIALATYTAGCTPTIPPTLASFALCSNGNLSILSAATGGTSIASNIPAVIISHGANGLGAYTPAGLPVLPAPLAGSDEYFNVDTTINNFVSHEFTTTYDDLVVWISPNILYNRMVSAGKLP